MGTTDVQQILEENLAAFANLMPLLVIAGGAVALLVASVFVKTIEKYAWFFYGLILAGALVSVDLSEMSLMGGILQRTAFNGVAQQLLIGTTLLLVLFKEVRNGPVEYHFLLLSTLVGSLLMTMAHHLLVIYLAIELTSLASYLLTAFSNRKRGYEAAMKYLLTGAISSAVMIYGISLIYGFSGNLSLAAISEPTGFAMVGWILFIGGILFKVSVVPFHMWVPSTYQAAPTSAVAFLTIVPKIGAFVLLTHVLGVAGSTPLGGLTIALALVTVLIGTFSAISQMDVKRLVAYGAMAHSGFLLPLAVFQGVEARAAFLFYAVIYALMNLAVFYFIAAHEGKKGLLLSDLSGAGRVAPFVGAAVVVLMLGLIGLPPTAGFSIKLVLFTEVWSQYQTSGGPLLMTYFVVGILSSAVSLYFYFKIPYHYFLVAKEAEATKLSIRDQLVTTFLALLVLWFFIQPGILNNFAVTIGTP